MTQDNAAACPYAAVATLRDGGSICIRDLRPDDKARLLAHFKGLSAQSRYFRFLGSKKSLSSKELRQFTELDGPRDAALIATLRQVEDERIIGVARYATLPDAPDRAEVAFAILDEHQGRGIGTVLLEHLASLACANGIRAFEADVLGDNNRMLQVFADSGFTVNRSIESGVVRLTFPTEPTPEYLDAHDRRDRHAAAESLRFVLQPRAVAVVGASRKPRSIGAVLVENLRRCGFRGPIYPVNPSAREIAGLPAYASVGAIGKAVDLAVVAVPAARVEEIVGECARAGVRAVVVISAGFAEASGVGREAESRLVALVRGSGMRMVGPNCMGVLNTDPAVGLNATFAPTWPPAGNIGMFTQSGALGLAILEHVRTLNVGISSFVSAGNKADVSGNDLLAYWAEDARTRVIVLYLESFGNPRKFARVAPAVARDKPIVVVKSGRSAAGTRAASSHSAALASLDVAVDALFEQAGVIRTNTLEELFDVAALLSTQPVPPGPGVGIVTNGGGPGILLADACAAHGLGVPPLAEATIAALRTLLPPAAALGNPVDMIASATPEQFARTIEIVGADAAVDALVAIYIPPMVTEPEQVAAAIARGAGTVAPEKPVLAVFMSTSGAPAALGAGPRGPLPSYGFPENAALALAAAERYGRWRRRPQGTAITLGRFERTAVRAVVDRVLASATEPVWVEPDDLWTILRAAGIDFAASELVAPADAAASAERLGYPLVAKAIAPGLLHKSDVGGVILDLASAAAVSAAVRTLAERLEVLKLPLERVLLQRQVPAGIEALVGVTTDPTFGPLLVCGLGGVLVELLRDIVYHLTPVTDLQALDMIGKLRAGLLLEGYRGQPPGDREALSLIIQRVSALVEAVPEIKELDLNPVKVLPPGDGAIVVDGRMLLGGR